MSPETPINPNITEDIPEGVNYFELEGRRAEDLVDDTDPWITQPET